MKYTPGPWTANGADLAKPYYINGPTGEVIVNGSNEEYGVIGRANAHLIAAAPELLEALQGLVNARWMATIDWAPTKDYEVFMDKANEAIAKATPVT